MRKLGEWLLVGSLAVFPITSAQANVVTYTFSGSLFDIRNTGAGLTYGQTFTATYTYDDTERWTAPIEQGRVVSSGGQFSVNVGSTSFIGTPTSELQIFDNYVNLYSGYNGADGFFVSSWSYNNWSDERPISYLIQFDLWDFTHTTLSSLSIPSQTQVTQLARSGRIFIREFSQSGETGLAGGYFQEFVPETAVPEPSSFSMVFLGLLASIATRLVSNRKWIR